MHSPRAVLAACIFLFSVRFSVAQTPPAVSYALQMGNLGRQNYHCVFSGIVRCHGRPCAGAHVHVDVSGDDQSASLAVDADEEGRYLARLDLADSPNATATWTLSAQTPSPLKETAPAQAEGHAILMEEEPVLVERPLEIDEP